MSTEKKPMKVKDLRNKLNKLDGNEELTVSIIKGNNIFNGVVTGSDYFTLLVEIPAARVTSPLMATMDGKFLFDKEVLERATAPKWKLFFVRLFGKKHVIPTMDGIFVTKVVVYTFFDKVYFDKVLTSEL